MTSRLYNPFENFTFDPGTCFLTGRPVEAPHEQIPVFPVWMMRVFDLQDKPFKMLDERVLTYKQLKMPCSTDTAMILERIESQLQEAMTRGYDAVRRLDPVLLFQWSARIVYGIVFNEIQSGVRQAVASGEPLNFSQALVHKFRNLHAMLQSVVHPMVFEERSPFSILVLPVDNAPDTFVYRDEINTLIFSLRMNDFVIIATLQDNGTHAIYHQDILQQLAGNVLHPIQAEELCARFFYSAYLFKRLPDYTFMETPSAIYVEPMPLQDWTMKPIFDAWQPKTYAQVLENFWKPWGYTLFEILRDPQHPMTFMPHSDGSFNNTISLPRA